MTSAESSNPNSVADLARLTRKRDLASIVADGVFFSVMVGLGEAYIPAFALACGFGDVVASLIATLPILVGGVLQLVTPLAVRRIGSYRRWVVLCAVFQAFTFLPLAVSALVGKLSLPLLALATIGYWASGLATGPAWNAWVTSLVPDSIRARFFANRTRAAQTSLFMAVLLGGAVLEWGRDRHMELAAFGMLFLAALVFRLISAAFLARQSEAPGIASEHRALRPREVIATIRAAGATRTLVYLLGTQAVVHVAAPFFTPFMLGQLGLSYHGFTILTAAAFLARVIVLPQLGRVAQRRGTNFVLWWGGLGIVPLPALWLLSDNFFYLLALQIWAGSAWAALELATLLSFFDRIEEGDRTSVLSAYNLGNAVAISIGALAGSQLFLFAGASSAAYVWIFVVSTIGRLAMLVLLRGIRPSSNVHEIQLRTLAVRPSAGAIERPILASLPHDDRGSAATTVDSPRHDA